jgi:hypothetical protein
MKNILFGWALFSIITSIINVFSYVFPNTSNLIFSINTLVQVVSIQNVFDLLLVGIANQLGIMYDIITVVVCIVILYYIRLISR